MAGRGSATLANAVRGRVVGYRLGQLLLPAAALAAVPALAALVFGETGFALRCAIVAAILPAVGALLTRIDAPGDVRPNEAMSVTALTFMVTAAAMSWPFAGEGLDGIDAGFESVSAITTTGLTTLADVERHTRAFLFTRAWMQWYGGLAIVVLMVALVLESGVAARRLAGGDVEVQDLVSSTRTRARYALAIYSLLSAIAFVALLAAGAGPFDALVHALASVSTGGFSSHNDSLAGAGGPAVRIAASVLSFAGAVSLMLYVRGWREGWRSTFADADLRALLWAVAAVALLVGLCMTLVGGRPWSEAARQAPLIAISAQTTTGFSTLDVGALDPASKLALVASMFVGGDTGSTAGGIKIARLLVVLALIRLLIQRTRLPPHAVAEPAVGGRRLEAPEVQSAITVLLLYLGVIFLSWLAFVAYGVDPLDSLFEVASAVGTVGLSTGVAAADLAPLLKGVLMADMLMGRLEVVAIIVLLYPPTWIGRRSEVT